MLKVSTLAGFYKPEGGKYLPIDNSSHQLAIIPNTVKRVKAEKALKYLNKGNEHHNKRLSALFLVKEDQENIIYKGDIKNPKTGLTSKFTLVISKQSGILKFTKV